MRKEFGKTNWLVPQPVLIITTYNKDGTPNAMNAAWGGMYDEHQIMICLASDHKTTENILRDNEFAVCFPTSKYTAEADYFGIVSGNEVRNKFEKVDLTTSKCTSVNAPYINEFPLTIECKVISCTEVCEGTTIVVASVVNTTVDKSILNYNGKPDTDKFDFICYDPMNHKYRTIGKEIADAFVCGLKIK
jgi:flavin reductase (DIM6/NTAB) family NADH-FMN oxidoreductase RutF